ncbi:hypothetical protein GKO28_18195 [Deefgea sp. CFH1-16]|nr:hypothetical protein [Deefgea sp. CFH1-16]
MGRNYISERTISDPKERAAHKKKKQKLRLQADQTAKAIVERNKFCANGCGQLRDEWWMTCCSESCFNDWSHKLTKR